MKYESLKLGGTVVFQRGKTVLTEKREKAGNGIQKDN